MTGQNRNLENNGKTTQKEAKGPSKGRKSSSDTAGLAQTSTSTVLSEAREKKQKGNDHYKAQEFDEAIKAYSQSMDSYSKYHQQRKESTSRNGHRMTHGTNQVDADEAEALRPRFNRGLAFYQQGRHQEALDDFTSVLDSDPSYGKCRMRRGDVYSGMEKYELALKDYQKARRLVPNGEDDSGLVKRIERMKFLVSENSKKTAPAEVNDADTFQEMLRRSKDNPEILQHVAQALVTLLSQYDQRGGIIIGETYFLVDLEWWKAFAAAFRLEGHPHDPNVEPFSLEALPSLKNKRLLSNAVRVKRVFYACAAEIAEVPILESDSTKKFSPKRRQATFVCGLSTGGSMESCKRTR
eukprot:gb/GECG01000649.1/.p1 GENE.gb/GECG01000649.1/~~gb/GECG01000649.1/.p1  ORF type:complete len:353 (+),score=52.59 gb/GECG01000649.1/:1-1059(+)